VESTISPRSDVTIVRDTKLGIPHITGTTRAGTMFGAGYAGAQDRLFLMDLMRHVARGKLTSFAGGAEGNRELEQSVWRNSPYTEADLQAQIDALKASGTRGGSLDPGVILYLVDELGMSTHAVERMIYQESGLLGVSGISSDMRVLEASSEPRAREAIDLFVYRIGRELGSLVAALGGLDAVVFTGGIGENSRRLREQVCQDAAWLGLALDAEANARHGPLISAPDSRVAAWVIPANEEATIACHTRALLGAHLPHATEQQHPSSVPSGAVPARLSTSQGVPS
jgi:hypothetical protein